MILVKFCKWWIARREANYVPFYGFTDDMLQAIKELEPGRALAITGSEGNEFTIMHSDDFAHIIGLAGLKCTERGPITLRATL